MQEPTSSFNASETTISENAPPADPARSQRAGATHGVLAAAALIILFLSVSGVVSGIVIVPAGLLLVALATRFAVAHGERWRFLGFRAPRSWPRALGISLLVALGLTLLTALALFPLMARLGVPLPDLSTFDALRGNPGQLLVMLAVSWILAAFGEEIIFRGFLFGAWRRLFGSTAISMAVALVLLSTAFGIAHAYQGPSGIVLTGFAGFVIGLLYLRTKNLWYCILAHGFTDTLGFVAIYLGWV